MKFEQVSENRCLKIVTVKLKFPISKNDSIYNIIPLGYIVCEFQLQILPEGKVTVNIDLYSASSWEPHL